MIDYISENCCGCRLCKEICPHEAITYGTDNDGFIIPIVGNTCTNCGLCAENCPMNKPSDGIEPSKGYMMYASNDDARRIGTSGGIFGLLAHNTIKKGGVVYGAAFDENLKLVTTKAENFEELTPLYKSKYLQCDTTDLFTSVEHELKTGRKVLVCNTPCNIAALKQYLKFDYDNLLLVDFVCHGVPSQDFFDKCIGWYKRKLNMTLTAVSFREKVSTSATPCLIKLQYKQGEKIKSKIISYLSDPFYLAFQKRISLRPSCYACQYATSKRVSDITIGDFHEIERYVTDLNRMDGVSMVLLNSSGGEAVVEEIMDEVVSKEFPVDVLVENNECLMHPAVEPKNRKLFFDTLNTHGIDYLIKKELNYKKEWKKILYYKMPKCVRKVLKKIIFGE